MGTTRDDEDVPEHAVPFAQPRFGLVSRLVRSSERRFPAAQVPYVTLLTDASRLGRLDCSKPLRSRGMKTIHTILREDFGWLDRTLVRSELLSEKGVHGVTFERSRNGLLIEYDPSIINDTKLIEIMCRYGVYPEPISPRMNGQLGDGCTPIVCSGDALRRHRRARRAWRTNGADRLSRRSS